MSAVDLSDLHFLVVDDQAFIRNLVQGMLMRLGARRITGAHNGEAAQKVLETQGPRIACIISDWNMQPMNGLQLLQEIRSGAFTDIPANIPFIMLTGFANSAVVTAAANLDVSAYIVKPVSSKRLADAIRISLTKPLTAKPPSFYRRIEVVEPPKSDPAGGTEVKPWASWIKSGRPVFIDEQATFIRREGVQLNEVTESDAPRVRLIRYKRADRIKPGAILVEDFCDANGVVLLNAGVILNERMIAQLRNIKTESGEPPRLWVGRT